MTFEQITLARARLWLGITNVGAWVLAAIGGLLWLMIHAKLSSLVDPRTLVSLGVGALTAQAGFDAIGGGWLMPAPRPAPGEFLVRWSRGVLGHTLILVGVGFLSLVSLRLSGGFAPAVLLDTGGLALGRPSLLRIIGTVTTRRVAVPEGGYEGVLAAKATDPAFTGGLAGFGRRARDLLPAG